MEAHATPRHLFMNVIIKWMNGSQFFFFVCLFYFIVG